MKNYLASLQEETADYLREIGQIAEAREWTAYVVGGFVRDVMLRRPGVDCDIVIEGDAVVVAQEFSRRHAGTLTVYRQFGTATVIVAGQRTVDFATARRETYPHPGALPVVSPGTIRDDLFRRDFTINAIALVVNPDRWGELVDFFQGQADLRGKKIRVLHDRSFMDDPTRILRAVRFEQRLGFSIESKTLRWFKAALRQGLVGEVKAPRYFEEFRKLLKEPRVKLCWQRLAGLKGLVFLGQGAKATPRQAKGFNRLPAALSWAKSHGVGIHDGYLLALMIALGPLPDERVEDLVRCYNLSNLEKIQLLAARTAPMALEKLAAKKLGARDVFQLLHGSTVETILFYRIATDSPIVRRRVDQYLCNWRHVRIQITGNDLIALGCRPGRVMTEILEEVLLQKIEGALVSPEDELDAARKMVASLK